MIPGGFDDSGLAMSQAPPSANLLDHFSALSDLRQRWPVVYPLPEILLPVLWATLCGMEDFVEIRMWGKQRLDFLRRFLPYVRDLPAHDMLNDVINALDPFCFKPAFPPGSTACASAPDIVAIDGKTSRRTHARQGPPTAAYGQRLGRPPVPLRPHAAAP